MSGKTEKIQAWVGKDPKTASEGKLEFQEVESKKWEDTDVDGEYTSRSRRRSRGRRELGSSYRGADVFEAHRLSLSSAWRVLRSLP